MSSALEPLLRPRDRRFTAAPIDLGCRTDQPAVSLAAKQAGRWSRLSRRMFETGPLRLELFYQVQERSDRVALRAQIGDDTPVLHLAGAARAVANLAVIAVTLGPDAAGVHTLRDEIGHDRIGTSLR